jgi:hypothetical protein
MALWYVKARKEHQMALTPIGNDRDMAAEV